MTELSIFVDESGDFGEYEKHAPYYIITLVMHNQAYDIEEELEHLESELSALGYPNHCVHTGPIIRGEQEYRYVDISVRQKIMKRMMTFTRNVNVRYKSCYIEKRKTNDSLEAVALLSKQIARFIRDNLEFFISFDIVKIYYDNGQTEVNKILASVFNSLLDHVEFRRVLPSSYRLFQVADLICTIELINHKREAKNLSNSEIHFFNNERTLYKNYIKPVKEKEM